MTPPILSDHYWGDWRGYDGIARAWYYIPINFQLAYNNGSRGTWLKACDGLAKTPFFHNAFADATKVYGKSVGAYLWQYKGALADAKKQGGFWYNEIAPLNCAASIDFEAYGSNIPEAVDLWASAYRMRELGFSQKLIVYTNWWYWLEHGNSDPAWLELFDGIWLADPDDMPPAPPPVDYGRKAPRPFEDYLFHQYSWTGDPAFWGVVNGKTDVDENSFNGTEEELANWFGGISVPPPIGEHDMYQGTCITASLNVRNAPSTGAVVGGLSLNDKVEADRVENGWWHLTKIRGVATTGENWSYEGATKNYIRTDAITQPPADSVKVEVYANGAMLHSKDVAAGGSVRIDITD